MTKTCQHNHIHINAEAAPSVDPTHTTVLRAKYSAEMYKRFRSLKGLIRTSIVDNNALKLGDYTPYTLSEPLDPGDYRETAPAKKVQEFNSWLDEAIATGILGATAYEAGRIISRNRWQREFIRKAYSKGILHANQSLRGIGVVAKVGLVDEVIQDPAHQSALQMLYNRNFNELKGVTDAMDQQISRRLAQGFAEGWNPRKMATEINDRVDKIGITRARVIARTETIRAHAHAQLNRYEQFGVKEVTAKVELLTAGDTRVCPICASLEGEVWSLARAKGVIPVHPRCRCSWTPVTKTYTR